MTSYITPIARFVRTELENSPAFRPFGRPYVQVSLLAGAILGSAALKRRGIGLLVQTSWSLGLGALGALCVYVFRAYFPSSPPTQTPPTQTPLPQPRSSDDSNEHQYQSQHREVDQGPSSDSEPLSTDATATKSAAWGDRAYHKTRKTHPQTFTEAEAEIAEMFSFGSEEKPEAKRAPSTPPPCGIEHYVSQSKDFRIAPEAKEIICAFRALLKIYDNQYVQAKQLNRNRLLSQQEATDRSEEFLLKARKKKALKEAVNAVNKKIFDCSNNTSEAETERLGRCYDHLKDPSVDDVATFINAGMKSPQGCPSIPHNWVGQLQQELKDRLHSFDIKELPSFEQEVFHLIRTAHKKPSSDVLIALVNLIRDSPDEGPANQWIIFWVAEHLLGIEYEELESIIDLFYELWLIKEKALLPDLYKAYPELSSLISEVLSEEWLLSDEQGKTFEKYRKACIEQSPQCLSSRADTPKVENLVRLLNSIESKTWKRLCESNDSENKIASWLFWSSPREQHTLLQAYKDQALKENEETRELTRLFDSMLYAKLEKRGIERSAYSEVNHFQKEIANVYTQKITDMRVRQLTRFPGERLTWREPFNFEGYIQLGGFKKAIRKPRVEDIGPQLERYLRDQIESVIAQEGLIEIVFVDQLEVAQEGTTITLRHKRVEGDTSYQMYTDGDLLTDLTTDHGYQQLPSEAQDLFSKVIQGVCLNEDLCAQLKEYMEEATD